MKQNFRYLATLAALTLAAGCATDNQSKSGSSSNSASGAVSGSPAGTYVAKYRSDDGRVVEIGKGTSSDGGLSFKNPHLEKCWIADGFNFTGYDTLYIAPTVSTAKVHEDEVRPQQIAVERLPMELQSALARNGLFQNIVTKESDIKPGAKVLRLETTITEYSKGGGAARYFAGLYGAGQPVLRVVGKMTDAGKTVFSFEGRRSGVSAGARMGGGFRRDEDIQIEDIRSLALDVADFATAIAGKYQGK